MNKIEKRKKTGKYIRDAVQCSAVRCGVFFHWLPKNISTIQKIECNSMLYNIV
jgi:hypothetical protein